jgi:hypothetical protein
VIFHIVNYLPALMLLLLHKKDKHRDAAELGLDEFSKLAKIKGTRSS